jgi:GNAT superfamily N-acetyltransferase
MDYEIIEIGKSNKLLKKFISFPRYIYQSNQYYVQPLRSEIKEKINPLQNPFFKYGKIKMFGVIDNNKNLVGRIVAIINPVYDKLYGKEYGFFGMFESINNKEVASLLINQVKSFFNEMNYKRLIGPVNFTTNEESGILIEGFDQSPTFMCAYNEKYYQDLIEGCGLVKAIDMFAYKGNVDHIYPEKFNKILNRISIDPNIKLRTFDKTIKEEDTKIIFNLYNECFKDVWGFVPLSLDEANLMTGKFLPFYDPELIWIAFINSIPAGFILGLPDINKVLKKINGKLFPFGIIRFYLNKNKIDSIRVLTLGVLPQFRGLGLESLLIHRLHERMKAAPYRWGEFSFIMENNFKMRKVLENLGFKAYKRYRIYETNI